MRQELKPPKRRWPRILALSGLISVLLIAVLASCGCGYSVARRALGTRPFDARYARKLEFRVPMRDGIELATQVHLPRGAGPWPVVLVRNPYNMGDWFGSVCGFLVRYAYACVHQDVRGRLGSQGEWVPLLHEREDGLDTLRWLSDQPWQNNRVGLFGMSYLAAVQWLMAGELPPQVRTMIPMFFSSDQRRVTWERGMFRPEIFTVWAALMPGAKLNIFGGGAYQKALKHMPAIEADEVYFGARLDWYREWLRSASLDAPVWNNLEFERLRGAPEHTSVPVLMVGGWYDIFIQGMLKDFDRLPTRDQSRFVIGPWTHLQHAYSDLDLPADPSMAGQMQEILGWLDHHLKDKPLEVRTGVVENYVVGEGRWVQRDHWPPRTRAQRLYLVEAPSSAQCQEGGLVDQPSGESRALTYRYDPANPVPSRGGAGLLAFALPGFRGVKPGIRAQPRPCYRNDVLSFISAPLEAPLRIAGAPMLRLLVASSAPDTAFSAGLMMVDKKGHAFNIRDSISSLSYRESDEQATTYQPGSQVTVPIEMWPIEWTVPSGSRLRLDISSSNFPAYHAHPNRMGQWAEQRGVDVAMQQVWVNGQGSYLELPVSVEGLAPLQPAESMGQDEALPPADETP